MDYDYNFENADYLTTLDAVRGSLYKVVANVNKEIFSLNKSIAENPDDQELVDKKTKLEGYLFNIIELEDSIAKELVKIDKLVDGNLKDIDVGSVSVDSEEAESFKKDIVGEVLKNMSKNKEESASSKKTEEKTDVEETPTAEETQATTDVPVEKEEAPAEGEKAVTDNTPVEESTPAVSVNEEPANPIEPPIEATSQDEPKEEETEASVDTVPTEEKTEEPASEAAAIYVANKTDEGVAKAILVTDDQFKKLDASRASQLALCKFRDALSGKQVVETKSDLESLMEKANELYQSGNLAEAEKIYNQISELNAKGQA